MNKDIVLLIKSTAMNRDAINQHYAHPLGEHFSRVQTFSVDYAGKKTISVSNQKAILDDVKADWVETGVKLIWCADSALFKTLTKERKAEPHLGYLMPCRYPGLEDLNVILAPNYQAMLYSPDVADKLELSVKTVQSYLANNYVSIGTGIVHGAAYPKTVYDIECQLKELHQYSELTCDIETFGLKFWEAGLGTIGFAWDQHNGCAFQVDTLPDAPNTDVRALLKTFFETYEGTLIFHNANFDMKILIAQLFMSDWLDEPGKQHGIDVFTRRFHDTKLITYLATNNTGGNKLSLKDQAHEFAGNYAQSDIHDITKIELDSLLEYNLIDCLSTWHVFDKHFSTLLEQDQLDVYETIFKPSVGVILHMELTGMPLNMAQVANTRKQLEEAIQTNLQIITGSKIVQDFTLVLREEAMAAANAKLKKKVKPIEDFAHVEFNPNSTPQMQKLFFSFMSFKPTDFTETKQPAIGGKILKKLTHQVPELVETSGFHRGYTESEIQELIEVLGKYFEADKVLNTFVKAFENSSLEKNGWHYLHGNFNLGGTVSGRLSSSGPNLQNMPSNPSANKWAKPVKQCFSAPSGWLFCGADFASLEDRISALTTKDPNKLKVYTDGYDGHCLRAYSYFKDQMPDIDPTSVDSINSIEKKYKHLRQMSKVPTFALTYGGTSHAIVGQTGLPAHEAQAIEAAYHELYKASDDWVASKVKQASNDGFLTVAFGMRVRTPLLHKCIMNGRWVPFEAQAEARTAGNALGQSWGLLNNRAAIELAERLKRSEYRYDILPVAHIHDAQYFLVKDLEGPVNWLNKNLVECMEWNHHEDIYHDEVGLGGELAVFYPDWSNEISLPNNANSQQILDIAEENKLVDEI